MDGTGFAFLNKGRHMLRLQFYDGSGFWLCTKRLSKGRFTSWPKGEGKVLCSGLLARELQILLWGGAPQSCGFPKLWRKIA
jgi:transposase